MTSPIPPFSSPAMECTFVVSRASSKVNGGRMLGMRLASMLLPEPGGPIIRTRYARPPPRFPKRAFGVVLAFHLGKIDLVFSMVRSEKLLGILPDWFQNRSVLAPAQEFEHLA